MTSHSNSELAGQLPPGTTVGPYVIRELVGAGGMGEVYRAHDERLGRDVALKVLPTAAASRDPDRVRRFELEARATAALSHPNILAVYDVGRHDDAYFLVTELLEGESLQQRILGGTVTVQEAVDVAIQVAHALSAAHGQDIVHRDLKPGNLFITRDGRLKVLDFGLARFVRESDAALDSMLPTESEGTGAGTVLGTVGYMAPEQARGEVADARADIFALGVVLYEMLARRSPFARDTRAETLSALLRDDPPPLSSTGSGASPALARIVGRCLAKRPEDRFQSAHDLALALEAVSSPSWVDPVPVEAQHRGRRVSRLVIAAACLVIALGVGAWVVKLLRVPDKVTDVAGEPAVEVVPRPPQNRVVVLPFVNKTGDPGNEAMGQGLAARVWGSVAEVPDVDVVPMAAVDEALASASSVAVDAAVNAGVEVSGSIFSEGSGYRIQAVVQDLLSGHLRPPADVVCLSGGTTDCARELAARVAEVVELQIKMPDLLLMLNRLPSYEAYRALRLEYDEERALALDPAIDICQRFDAAFGQFYVIEANEGKAVMQDLLETHRGSLSDFGDHMVRGGLVFFENDYRMSQAHFRKAVEFEPSSLVARGGASYAARALNRPAEVLDIFADIAPCDNPMGWRVVRAYHQLEDFANALDASRTFHDCFPQNMAYDRSEVKALAALGRVDEMNEVLERLLTRPRTKDFFSFSSPASVLLDASRELRYRGDPVEAQSLAERACTAYAGGLDAWRAREQAEPSVEQEMPLVEYLWQAGRESEALGLYQAFVERVPDHVGVVSFRGSLAARSGDRQQAEEADAVLATAGKTRRDRMLITYDRSCMAAQLGDIERALDLLREAITLGFWSWEHIRIDPDLEPLHDNPAFQELVRPKG